MEMKLEMIGNVWKITIPTGHAFRCFQKDMFERLECHAVARLGQRVEFLNIQFNAGIFTRNLVLDLGHPDVIIDFSWLGIVQYRIIWSRYLWHSLATIIIINTSCSKAHHDDVDHFSRMRSVWGWRWVHLQPSTTVLSRALITPSHSSELQKWKCHWLFYWTIWNPEQRPRQSLPTMQIDVHGFSSIRNVAWLILRFFQGEPENI